jgi:hypothetical protein
MRIALPAAVLTVLATGLLVPATATAGGAEASASHTHRVVVRPVDRAGRPVSGWTVHRQRHLTVSCSEGSAASAVDDGIAFCGPSAAFAPACWKSVHHTVLCLRDAHRKKLVRLRYTGSFQAGTAPADPDPLDLTLRSGRPCQGRVGGAWAPLPSHPHWAGFFSCTTGDVYGPVSGDGVNRGRPVWTVHLWKRGTPHRVVVRRVRTAYFVGTHR